MSETGHKYRRRAWSLILLLSASTASVAAPTFDYWVLALHWAPETCAALRGAPNAAGCDARRGLVPLGLWPRLEAGAVTDCAPLPAAPDSAMSAWQTQGHCSGLTPNAYAEALERAAQSVQVPEKFLRGRANQRISKSQLQKALLDSNPGFTAEALTIECRSHYLTEIRVCLDVQLEPRACGAEVSGVCERELIIRPQGG